MGSLTETQRATIALRMMPELREEARKRQATSTGGEHPQLRTTWSEADEAVESGRAREHAARMVGCLN